MQVLSRWSLVVLLLLAGDVCGQRCDSIAWTPGKVLKWRYFKDRPGNDDSMNARSQINIGLHYETMRKFAMFHVTCHFLTCSSWIKPDWHDELLQHEQLHFDIAEYYRRMLVKQVLGEQFTTGDLIRKMNAISDSISRQRMEMDAFYDGETHHSLQLRKQKEWEDRVHSLLRETEAFAKSQFLIALN